MRSRSLRRRSPVARLALGCLLLVGFGPFVCNDRSVEEANRQIRAAEAEPALTTLAQVDDDAAEVHLSRAIANFVLEQPEAGRSALDQTYRLIAAAKADGEPREDEADLRSRVAFARGLALAKEEKWEDAQVEFMRALEIDPEDEDARWNYEMAWSKANPICPLREDDHEPDDTRSDAKPYDPEKAKDRLLCPANEDWYTIEVKADTLLYISLKGQLKQWDPDDTREATLALFGPDDPDDRPIREAPVLAGQAKVGMSWVRSDGIWKIRVAGPGMAELIYALEVQIVPPCPVDDQEEDNDTPETAKPVDGEKPGLKACPGDPDWYAITVPKDEKRQVTIEFDPERGPISAQLVDPKTNEVLAEGQSNKGGLALRVAKKDEEQSLLLKVEAATDQENIYALKVGDGEGGQDQQQQDPQDQDEQDEQDEQDPKDKQDKPEPKDGEDEAKPEPKPSPPAEEQVDLDKLIEAIDKHERNPQLEKALRQQLVVPRMEDY